MVKIKRKLPVVLRQIFCIRSRNRRRQLTHCRRFHNLVWRIHRPFLLLTLVAATRSKHRNREKCCNTRRNNCSSCCSHRFTFSFYEIKSVSSFHHLLRTTRQCRERASTANQTKTTISHHLSISSYRRTPTPRTLSPQIVATSG